jgi:DNA-binding transcriptional regulator YbjK
MVVQLFQDVVFLGHRLQLDHRHVAALAKVPSSSST